MEKFLFEESHFFSVEFSSFMKHTFLLLPNWKWIVLIVSIFLGIALRPLLQLILKELKQHNPWAKRTSSHYISYLFRAEIERPTAWALISLVWFAVGDAIELSGKFESYYEHVLKAFLAIQIIRLIYRAVDAAGLVFADIAKKSDSTLDDQLVPFAGKILKALVVILGFLIVLQSFGLNVMSLLAGLGLGGLALALAAQDTAANLFGSVTILIDNPCQIGDWVKIKDVEGTVEEIGFRSTRIRTFYNSLITIPNGTMAKETIDNMGARPARRIRQTLGLAYETTPKKIEEFCDRVHYLIQQNEKVTSDSVTVNFNNFNASTLDVLVNFHAKVYTGAEEMQLQQQLFLEILKIAAEIKVEFAYPTQTVYYRGSQG